MTTRPDSEAPAFPDLGHERDRLAFARACRDRMIDQLERVDPQSSADEITAQYVEMTVWEALDSLRSPGSGQFFGRIDEPAPDGDGVDRWYIGRRHIETPEHDPVVVDWRAPISAPFYRATAVDPLGVVFRRRFTFSDDDLSAYLDEHLDDPDAADVAAGNPRPGPRRDRGRPLGRDARDRGDDPGRAGHRDPLRHGPGADRAGRARHRQDSRRTAPRRLPAVRASLTAGPRRCAGRRAEPGVPRLHRERAPLARGAQRPSVHGHRAVYPAGRDQR